ncbi:protein abrupt isoform X3 [Episyrphus balteatus]|uniref:protein abrupt isoform X3 n=1 Tax=Episyrphus balteatus TaxID=286459 RepID=UPI00248581D7|nr:protein abrupt isoform X3 [Episyrphus balteatus]
MTESTQLQTTENNNTGVAKMEPPPPISTSPSPSSHNNNNNDQQQHQQNHHSQNPFHNQQQQQHYALKWNDFQTSMLSSFRHLRDEEDFVDVTLACDQRSFTAHKVVLSACSPYFRKLLKANPCEHPIVILRDIRCEDVENLLSFMYNGEVNVSHEQLSDFLKTAHLLQVRGLADVNGSSSKLSSITSTKLSLGSSNINNVNNSNNNNNSNSATPSAVVAALTSSSSSTPAVQELKASPSPVRQIKSTHHWDLSDDNRTSHLTPPPQKRIKSADLFRAQHGISPERLLIEREFPVNSSGGVGIGSSNSNSGQHPLTRERNRDRDHSRETSRDRDRDRDRSLELRDSLLSQALESGQQMGTNQKHPDLASLHAQSAGEESNSSDTEPSDRGDGQMDGTMDSLNGSLDNQRSHSFPSAFLGLQGIPGLLPGPSGIHGGNDFDIQNKYGLMANVKEELADNYTTDEQNLKPLSSSPSSADVHSNEIPKSECNGVDNDIDDEQHSNRPKSLPQALRSPSPDNSSNDYSNDSSSSAMSLTVKHNNNNNNNTQSTDPALFHSLVQQHHHHQQQQQQHQQQNNQRQQQQHQQHFMQRHHQDNKRNMNQLHMDEMQSHQHQLTANLFMARTIALSRSRDFPEILQNTTAAAAAAAAAAASTTATAANSNYLLPCPLCETPLEQRVFRQHLDRHYPRDSPVCPVLECGRRFAHPNSVRNHMRIKHTLQWAKMKAMRSSGGPFSGIPDFK